MRNKVVQYMGKADCRRERGMGKRMKNQNDGKKFNIALFLWDRIKPACCYFTVAMCISFLFRSETNGASYLYIYSCMAFSLCLSFIQLVMRIKNVSYIIKLVLHMLLTFIVFTVIFFIVNSRGPNGQPVFTTTTYAMLSMLIAVVYAVLGTIGYVYSRRVKREKDEKNYKNQFSK